jgi:hypothetical protein
MSLAAAAQSGSAPGSAPSLANPLGGTGASEKPSAGSTASKAAAAGTYREIKWDDLVPKDWDPLKQFKDINFSLLSDSVTTVFDFISAPGWEKPLALLARRHDVVALRLQDPVELNLPNVGMLWLQDAETGEQLMVDGNDAAFRQRFAELAQQRELDVRERLAKAGVDALVLRTDEALDSALLRFVQLRKRVSTQSAGVRGSVSAGVQSFMSPGAAATSHAGASAAAHSGSPHA